MPYAPPTSNLHLLPPIQDAEILAPTYYSVQSLKNILSVNASRILLDFILTDTFLSSVLVVLSAHNNLFLR